MGRTIRIVVFAGVFLSVLSCAQVVNGGNTVVPGNSAPVASFIEDLLVTGSDTAAVNGSYLEWGTNSDGSKSYSNTNGSYVYKLTGYCDYWRIGNNTNDFGTFKINGIRSTEVPCSIWSKTCSSSSTTPRIYFKNAVLGYPFVGQIVYAPSYVYTDAEGDLEGSSIYSWYRCNDTNDPGTLISGETGTNYTLSASDNGKYLCYSVTPVASGGTTVGASVRSRYFGPIQTIASNYVVSGAGNINYNGIYSLNGFYNGHPYYKHQTANYYIFSGGCNGYWRLFNSLTAYNCAYTTQNFTSNTINTNDAWYTQCSGTAPAPAVLTTNL